MEQLDCTPMRCSKIHEEVECQGVPNVANDEATKNLTSWLVKNQAPGSRTNWSAAK
jgi:hypothetical protein